eukprot:TRINITY_DN473_c0_g1_i8.p1 TRINITY_DN473_c0_g1~~TRINITY_DN473_c0_g1_i8.p1  ORF type:complete len:830 (-),score=189.80 TRINITY_DN473_c0_g1_i8:58-2466(-)
MTGTRTGTLRLEVATLSALSKPAFEILPALVFAGLNETHKAGSAPGFDANNIILLVKDGENYRDAEESDLFGAKKILALLPPASAATAAAAPKNFETPRISPEDFKLFLQESQELRQLLSRFVAKWLDIRSTWLSQSSSLNLQSSQLFNFPIPTPGGNHSRFVFAGLFGADPPVFFADDSLYDSVITNGCYNALINVSGWGKTRRIFEMLARRFGLYLCCSSKKDSSSAAFPDLLNEFLELPKERAGVRHYFSCLVKAYLLILDALKQGAPDLTPLEWLAIQLHGSSIGFDDSLRAVSWLLRPAFQLHNDFCPNDFVVVIDEAQVIGNTFEYLSTYDTQAAGEPKKRSLMQVLAKDLTDVQVRVLLSGTGLSLSKPEKLQISSVGSTWVQVKPFSKPSPFLEEANLRQFFRLVLRTEPTEEQFAAAFRVLKGRGRFSGIFLENYLRTESWSVALEKTKLFFQNQFIRLLAEKNLQDYQWSRLVVPFYFCEPIFKATTEAWQAIETGFAEVRFVDGDRWESGIQEPLVLFALNEHLESSGGLLRHALQTLEVSCDRGVQGKLFECPLTLALFLFMHNGAYDLRSLFDADNLVATRLQSWQQLAPFLIPNQRAQLWVPPGFDETCRLVQRQQANEDLLAIFEQPKAPFIFPTNGEGPDVIFFLVSKDNKRIPCFVQSKIGDEFHGGVRSLEKVTKMCAAPKHATFLAPQSLRIVTDFAREKATIHQPEQHKLDHSALLRVDQSGMRLLFGKHYDRLKPRLRSGQQADAVAIPAASAAAPASAAAAAAPRLPASSKKRKRGSDRD